MFPTTGRGHASGERIFKQSIPAAPLFVRRMKQFPHGSYWAHAWGLAFQSVIQPVMFRAFQHVGSGPAVVGEMDLHLAAAAAAAAAAAVVSFVAAAGAAIVWWRKKKTHSNMKVIAGIAIAFGRATVSGSMNLS